MNVNEVLANRASEILGGERGEKRLVHPNDDVNKGQSSNDTFPTAMHVAAVIALDEQLQPAVRSCAIRSTASETVREKSSKSVRTHLQDATPLTLGQEFSGTCRSLTTDSPTSKARCRICCELALGGTAVGTGLTRHPRFGRDWSGGGMPRSSPACRSSPRRTSSRRWLRATVWCTRTACSRRLPRSLMKIANDVRWLAAAPRCGIGELTIPENEPGQLDHAWARSTRRSRNR